MAHILLLNIYSSTHHHLIAEAVMIDTAKFIITRRSQALWLPLEYRLWGNYVFIRCDPITGNVALPRRPNAWIRLFRPL